MKEILSFKSMYEQFIPDCSELIFAERIGKRFYGILCCKNHGNYRIRGDDLKHRGCKNCKREKVKKEYDDKWKKECSEIHNNKYDYSNTIVGNVLTKSEIKCLICSNIFKQTPASHKIGRGCPICYNKTKGKWNLKTINEVIKRSKAIGFNYDFSKSIYKTCKDDILIICDKGHEFWQSPDELLNAKQGCQKCSKGCQRSKAEEELFNFVSTFYPCEYSNRKILEGKELDIYIPHIKLGIEYNGLYWHSDDKIKTTHFEKRKLTSEKEIHLINIFEDDWVNKKEVLKNKLIDTLQIKTENYTKIHFANTDIKIENTSDIINIYNESSLDSEMKFDNFYVMYYNDIIIGIAPFIQKNNYKLITQIIRPLNSNQSNYREEFLNYFYNNGEKYKILVCLDWLDDLYLDKNIVTCEGVLKPIKRYIIYNKTTIKEPIKYERTITKTGYAIYKI